MHANTHACKHPSEMKTPRLPPTVLRACSSSCVSYCAGEDQWMLVFISAYLNQHNFHASDVYLSVYTNRTSRQVGPRLAVHVHVIMHHDTHVHACVHVATFACKINATNLCAAAQAHAECTNQGGLARSCNPYTKTTRVFHQTQSSRVWQ